MNKFTALSEIFELENVPVKLAKYSHSIKHTDLLSAIAKHTYSLKSELNVSDATITRTIKAVWPEKPVGSTKLCTYLLNKYDLKYCSNCKEVKELDAFTNNAARPKGKQSHCKECCLTTRTEYQRQYQASRRSNKLDRTPEWADLAKIQEFYANCPTGWHVDHIVPLKGKLVSGLHTLNNLQYLPALDNITKGNKFVIE